MTTKHEKDWQKVTEQGGESGEQGGGEGENIRAEIPHPSYEGLEEQLTAAEQKAQANWNKYLQSLADFENYKKRAERDVTNAYKFNLEKIIVELLPVIDSLEKSLEATGANQESHQQLYQGVELTLKMLLDMLVKFGVKQLDPNGEAFNPTYHEAMSMQPAPAGVLANTVMAVLQKGYILHDRLIRPARVMVAK